MAFDSGNIDLASSIALAGALATALLAFFIAARLWGRHEHERLARESGIFLLGKVPMQAVYAAVVPVGRGLARLGVSANAVSISSLLLAGGAGTLFAFGHFGAGTAVAVIAAIADALDGIVARESHTASRFGQVLDTTLDRYVDALFFGGIAVFVRESALLLSLTLAALVGGFMVSYASSVLRELAVEDRSAPMRRAHRLAYLLLATALVPFVDLAFPTAALALRLSPVLVALGAIAVIANVSAVLRLLRAARKVPTRINAAPRSSLPAAIEPAPSRSFVTRERLP